MRLHYVLGLACGLGLTGAILGRPPPLRRPRRLRARQGSFRPARPPLIPPRYIA